jgi:hypothetical protein
MVKGTIATAFAEMCMSRGGMSNEFIIFGSSPS